MLLNKQFMGEAMVTLRKIAEACSVSLATVSKALNDAPDLSKITKERIQKVAKEMGYMPNVAAKALRTSRSFSFGIIYEEAAKYGLTHEFFSRILNSFMRGAQTLGYDVFFLGDQLGGKHISYAEHGRYRNCDGILIIAGTDRVADVVNDVRQYDCPIACIDFEFDGISSVVSDNTQGVRDLVDLHVGMLSKAPAGLGGFCAASASVIRHLRLYARTYFFSTAMPPPVAGGLVEVFKLLAADAAGRGQLWRNIRDLRARLSAAGFDIGPGGSGIVPLYVRDESRLAAFHADLVRAGLYANLVSFPACRRKECRLRLCVMKDHAPEDIAEAAEILATLGRKHGVV